MTVALAPETGARDGGAAAGPIALGARTIAGERLVAVAEELAGPLGELAGAHDRAGTYPEEAIALLKDAGWLRAAIGADLGGLGVTSVHDLAVASSRLARANASVAIGVNMHTIPVLNIERRRLVARARSAQRTERAFATTLEEVVRDGLVLAAATSEPGQDLTLPATTATRIPGGWRIDGAKVFCTMSPVATHLFASLRYADDEGIERYAYAMVPAGAPGVVIHDDWDALGMRSSGSNSVSLRGVELGPSAVRGGFPAGEAVPYMERNLPSGLFHASASLGIAESADALARAGVARRGGGARDRMLVADNAVELAAARGVLSRSAALLDDHRDANPASDGTDAEIRALFAEVQAAKAFVNEAAFRVVDRALALSGGAGYMAAHPLARAYRDVRAGAFMHPLGANRAYDHIAAAALGERAGLH
jgi:alkylation response protein AidB-like acyl-CoA dehydrogenase